jgi:hypothetical protein
MTRGNFFAIDRRAWHYVCGLGGINPAVAYLVQAWGTGRDNRTTSYSTNAIEKYTPIARSRAKAAVARLVDAGATRITKAGSRPRYYITPAHEIAGCRARRHPEPQWIWLPNELVTSTGAVGEIPPVALVHNSGDPMLLRMLVDLYDAQNLVDDAGVSFRKEVWQRYSRVEIGRYAEFIIYGFLFTDEWCKTEGSVGACHLRDLTRKEQAAGEKAGRDFWRRLTRLVALGLVEWVPHLVTNASDEAEIIHPYTDELGKLAHDAAMNALTAAQRLRATTQGHRLAPVRDRHTDAQMVGILRMRYRTKSSLTAAWIAMDQERREAYVVIYEELLNRLAARAA